LRLVDLNDAVKRVASLPRVEMPDSASRSARTWLGRKHADGAVHEPATLAALLVMMDEAPPQPNFFDLGALFGYFTLFVLDNAPGAKVWAFEAHPAGPRDLNTILGPGDAMVVHAMMTDIDAEDVDIWVSGFNLYERPKGGWCRLQEEPGAMKPRGANNEGRGFALLTLMTLDHFCEATGVGPDFMKVDVEAYQARALRGGLCMIAEHKPQIVIELHDPEKIARMGTTNQKTVQPLFDLGYRGYWCGNFRAGDATFEEVDHINEDRDRLSLMVFTT